MRNIEKILPGAVEAVKKNVLNDKNEVPKEFNGYISSFGASIIMGGLLPTLVFFSQESKSKGDRKSVVIAIEEILKQHHANLLRGGKLLETVQHKISNHPNMEYLQEKIQEAGIALKLAIRIFPKSKN